METPQEGEAQGSLVDSQSRKMGVRWFHLELHRWLSWEERACPAQCRMSSMHVYREKSEWTPVNKSLEVL